MKLKKEQLERARAFAKKYMLDHPEEANDTWSDFEDLDLHMYFDELPEEPDSCGVYAYKTYTDEEGFTNTDIDSGVKILAHDLSDTYKEFGEDA